MKTKSLLVLLLAGIWSIGSWWWYTCKVKGFCGTEHSAAQLAAEGAATAAGAAALSSKGDNAEKADADKAKAEQEKLAAEQAAQEKADADKAKAEQEKLAAEQAAQEKADADKAKAEQEKLAAEQAAQEKADADKAKAEQEKLAAEQATQEKADADKAKAEQEKLAAEQTAQEKADADKAKADADKVTIQTDTQATNGAIGPATLNFPSGSANPQLAKETQAYFEKVAAFLKDNSTAKVIIVGHTDNKGDPAKNKALGQQRADILRDKLVKLGAPQERIETASEGPNKPIADNNSEEGRKKNRRVEITPIK